MHLSTLNLQILSTFPIGGAVYLKRGITAKTRQSGDEVFLNAGSKGYLLAKDFDIEVLMMTKDGRECVLEVRWHRVDLFEVDALGPYAMGFQSGNAAGCDSMRKTPHRNLIE